MIDKREIVEKIRAIMPALPGFYMLTVVWAEDGKPHSFSREPIIAWDISVENGKTIDGAPYQHTTPWPISPLGGDGDHYAIMNDDGSVSAFECQYRSDQEWFNAFVADWLENSVRKIQKAAEKVA